MVISGMTNGKKSNPFIQVLRSSELPTAAAYPALGGSIIAPPIASDPKRQRYRESAFDPHSTKGGDA